MKNDKSKERRDADQAPNKSAADSGQGSAGNFGSDADHSTDLTSGNDDKSKKRKKNSSPVPIKHQD